MKQILLLTIAAVSMLAADATGKWTGTMTPNGGAGNSGPALVILKQDGTKLTGTAGPNEGEQHEIKNGKAENGNLTFELGDGDRTMKFALKHEGDTIKGEMSRSRDGQSQTAALDLKREK